MTTLTKDKDLKLEDWQGRAKVIKPQTQAFIDGEYRAALSGKTFECVNPATGQTIAQIASCQSEDVDVAVASARKAFDSGVWSEASPKERKNTLLRFAQKIRDHAEELALLETLDMGKPIKESLHTDIPLSADCISWFAETIDKTYDEIAPTGRDALALISREPMGVVSAVVPWNFPLLMAAWKIGPALATGNSLIVKPAEQSPLTAIRVAELAIEAGLPKGVLNVVPGLGESAGQALGMHMDVDCVAFTGSAEVGKLFLQYSGKSNMKRISLECGGKSPHIILADCHDLDKAAQAAAFGIFYNQGEVCNAGSRLLVQDSVKDEVLDKVIAWGKKLAPRNPLDPQAELGSMVDKNQMDRVMGYIAKGQEEGAQLRLGGQRVMAESGGYFIEPTVFDQVNNDMTIAQEEIFGPVLSTITFKDLEEAIRIGNQSCFGLAAAIWTRDITVAHKAAKALRAGTVWVNCFDHGSIAVPFGGFKQSGIGRDKSLHALDKYTELKTTWINLG
jgi:4-guanidinobutyraldehyde dehydrogenase / NAD-dependent aldehyde dehydrogenase